MDYAITFTLRPNLFREMPEHQFDIASNLLKVLFQKYKKTLVVEFTQNYNIHIHGIVYSNTKRELYDIIRKNKVFGYICVRQITEFDVWAEYIVKETIKTYKELSCRYPVICNDYNITYKLLEDDPIAEMSNEVTVGGAPTPHCDNMKTNKK